MKTYKETLNLRTPYGDIWCNVEYKYIDILNVEPEFDDGDEPEFKTDVNSFIGRNYRNIEEQFVTQIIDKIEGDDFKNDDFFDEE